MLILVFVFCKRFNDIFVFGCGSDIFADIFQSLYNSTCEDLFPFTETKGGGWPNG